MSSTNGTSLAVVNGTSMIDLTDIAREVAALRPELGIAVCENKEVILPPTRDLANAIAVRALERTLARVPRPRSAILTGSVPPWVYCRVAHILRGVVDRVDVATSPVGSSRTVMIYDYPGAS